MFSALLPGRRFWQRLLLGLTTLAFAAQVTAETIAVRSAVVRAQDDFYVIDAEFDFALTAPLEEALLRGTALLCAGD